MAASLMFVFSTGRGRRRKKRSGCVAEISDAHQEKGHAEVLQEAHGVKDGLMSVDRNEVLQVGDSDAYYGVRKVLGGEPALVGPAEFAVSEPEDDLGGEHVDGQLDL